MDTVSDEQLMISYRDGDANAFTTLYSRHKGPLFRYLLRGCGNRATAEELFQEVWVGLIGARQGYRPDATFKTYLFHLAHNRLVDHYRRTRLRPVDDGDEEAIWDARPSPQAEIEGRDCVALLRRELDRLPQEQRDVFVLKEETGMTLEQIGAVVGAVRETVKSRLRYAMQRLRSALEDCL